VDVRVIAATNRDLPTEIRHGRFREDLYYRLSVFPIRLPPLRERAEDVPLLAHYFVDRAAARIGRSVERIDPAGLQRLAAYPWHGNVRELENVIERALILCAPPAAELGDDLLAAVLAGPGRASPAPAAQPPLPDGDSRAGTLDDAQRRHVEHAIRAAGGRIEGPGGAARALGLAPSTLRSLMKRLGVARPP
jgi:transcriptional regulator with GAF, ATPase, and Fis domain